MGIKKRIKRLLSSFPGEKTYWENRYKEGGNSGSGSYGRLAEFKAHFINKFVSNNEIRSVIDFGVGDGNQLSLFDFYNIEYLGLDISKYAIDSNRDRFSNRKNFSFDLIDTYAMVPQKTELSISLDVIFHIISEKKLLRYFDLMFNSAERFVIIYSSNRKIVDNNHVLERNFSDIIAKRYRDWKLINHVSNPYPYKVQNPDDTSRSEFFIYAKQ